MSGSAACLVTGAFVLAVSDRDTIDATIFAAAAIPAAPLPFLVERPRVFRLATAVYALVFVPYAFVFGLAWDGAQQLFSDERWVLWPAALLMAVAAVLPSRS